MRGLLRTDKRYLCMKAQEWEVNAQSLQDEGDYEGAEWNWRQAIDVYHQAGMPHEVSRILSQIREAEENQ